MHSEASLWMLETTGCVGSHGCGCFRYHTYPDPSVRSTCDIIRFSPARSRSKQTFQWLHLDLIEWFQIASLKAAQTVVDCTKVTSSHLFDYVNVVRD